MITKHSYYKKYYMPRISRLITIIKTSFNGKKACDAKINLKLNIFCDNMVMLSVQNA